MAIQSNCPQCTKRLALPETGLGKKIRCPHCEHVFIAQAPTPAPRKAPPPLPPIESPKTDTGVTTRTWAHGSEANTRPRQGKKGAGTASREGGKARSAKGGDGLPWYVYAPALLPLLIPALTLGGVVPVGLGVGLCVFCLAIASMRSLSALVRVGITLAISLTSLAIVGGVLLVVAVTQMLDNQPRQQAAEPPRVEENVERDFPPPAKQKLLVNPDIGNQQADLPDQKAFGTFDGNWREFSPVVNISVHMPGAPAPQPEFVPSQDGMIQQVRYILRHENVEFAIFLQSVEASKLQQHPLEARFDTAIKLASDRVKGKNLQQKALKIGDWTGREWHFDAPRGFQYFGRVCAFRSGVDYHFVHITLGGRGLNENSLDVRKFLDSLRLPTILDLGLDQGLVQGKGEQPWWQMEGQVVGAAFLENGKALMAVTQGGRIHMTELSPPKVRAPLMPPLPSVAIRSFALSPDGTHVALGGTEGWVFLCELATGQVKATFKHQERASTNTECCVAFSPNARLLASGHDRIRVWSLDEQKLLWQGNHGISVCFSPDGRTLAIGQAQNKVVLCDAATGKELVVLDGGVKFARDRGAVWAVAFSHDGTLLACGGYDLTMRLWDLKTQEQIPLRPSLASSSLLFYKTGKTGKTLIASGREGVVSYDGETGNRKNILPTGNQVHALAVSPDGKRLAAVHPKGLQLWDLPEVVDEPPLAAIAKPEVQAESQGQVILKGNNGPILHARFADDDKSLITVSHEGALAIWNLAPLACRSTQRLETRSPLNNAVSSVDGRWVAGTNYNGDLYLFDQKTGKREALAQGLDLSLQLSFALDSTRLAVTQRDQSVSVWEVPKLKLAYSRPGSSALFSPDGKYLALGKAENAFDLLDPQSGKELATFPGLATQFRGNTRVRLQAFSPDMTLHAAFVDPYNFVRVTNLKTRESTLHTLQASAASLAFTRDNKHLVIGRTDAMSFWDLAAGKFVAEAKVPEAKALYSNVHCVTFSGNENHLVGSRGDLVRLVDPTTLSRQFFSARVLFGHPTEIVTAVFSPDGRTLLTGGFDRTMKKWDLQSGQIVESEDNIVPMKLLPDGKHLLYWEPTGPNVLFNSKGKLRVRNQESKEVLPGSLEDGWFMYSRRLVLGPEGGSMLLPGLAAKPDLKAYRLPTFELDTSWDRFGKFDTLTVSPDGKSLAGYSAKNMTQIFDIASGKLRGSCDAALVKQTGGVRLVFTPDSRALLASGDLGLVRILDAESAKETSTLVTGQKELGSIALHPNGRWLATGGAINSVALWDLQSLKRVGDLSVPVDNGKFFSRHPQLYFSPDGQTLISTGKNQVVLWESARIFPK